MINEGTTFVNSDNTKFVVIQQVAGFEDKFVLQNLSTEGVFVMTKNQIDNNLTRLPDTTDKLYIEIKDGKIILGSEVYTHQIVVYDNGTVSVEEI